MIYNKTTFNQARTNSYHFTYPLLVKNKLRTIKLKIGEKLKKKSLNLLVLNKKSVAL